MQAILQSFKNSCRELLEETATNSSQSVEKMQQIERGMVTGCQQNTNALTQHQEEFAKLAKLIQAKDSEIQNLTTSIMSLKNQTIALQEHIVTLENLVVIKNDYTEKLKNADEKMTVLVSKDKKQSKKIEELETIIESDAKKSLELEQRIENLRSILAEKDQVRG